MITGDMKHYISYSQHLLLTHIPMSCICPFIYQSKSGIPFYMHNFLAKAARHLLPSYLSLSPILCLCIYLWTEIILCQCFSKKKKRYSVERWDAHLKVIQFCLFILSLSLNIHWQRKHWCHRIRLYESNVLTCFCSSSNMGTMRQDEEGHFPGPTHPHRNPQAHPWLVVVPLGKNGQLELEFLIYVYVFLHNGESISLV